MEIKIIKTQEQNEIALKEIALLMSRDDLSQDEQDTLELLFMLVHNFEEKAYVLPEPTPQEMISYIMEERGYTRKDLEKQLGAASRVSEVMSGKRKLSLAMIRKLHKNWGIPLEPLIA